MAIFNRIRSSVKPQTTGQPPKAGARTIFDSGQRRTARGFGSMILPWVPYDGSRPYTSEDEQWWASESSQPERVLHARIMQEISAEADRMAEEAEWNEAYENAWLPL